MLLDSDPGHVLKHTGPCDNVVHAATVLLLLQREVQLQEDLGRDTQTLVAISDIPQLSQQQYIIDDFRVLSALTVCRQTRASFTNQRARDSQKSPCTVRGNHSCETLYA